jgi:hypothetical protein
MSDNKGRQASSFMKGFSPGTGLRLWLFFLFCFFFLGYPVPLSILLGFAGGLAGGWAYGWWKSSEGPREVEPEDEEDLEVLEERSPRRGGLRLAKQRREAKARKRSQTFSVPFSGFLRR